LLSVVVFDDWAFLYKCRSSTCGFVATTEVNVYSVGVDMW
jgi:hypothetical protein